MEESDTNQLSEKSAPEGTQKELEDIATDANVIFNTDGDQELKQTKECLAFEDADEQKNTAEGG
eukprot:70443-Pyramimonas_sp.AAC.1